jgi:putative ABC transport system permease protein
LNIKLTGRDLPDTLQAIDRLWKQTGETKPITRLFLDQEVQALYLDITRQTELFTMFAGVALFIACLGLFGLSVFATERRTKEIGIRKAMGANRFDIVKLLVWQFAKPVLWANLIAWPVGWYFMNRWLHGFAYHVTLEPWIFIVSGIAALLIALATVSIHAFLVARAKPVAALRYE